MTLKLPATYPAWVFDESPIADPFGHGERAVTFLRNLKHPESRHADRAFECDRWVERVIRRTYGPRALSDDPADQVFAGDRIVKTVFILAPRGAHKSGLGGALSLLHLIGPEKVASSQIVCAAADKKQASIVHGEAAKMLRMDRRLSGLVKVTDHTKLIRNLKTDARFEAISADGATQHGRTPRLVVCDELHAWKDHNGLWEALRTGLSKVRNSLNVIITTAGRGERGVAWDQYQYARAVAIGKIDDPSYLPVLLEAPRDCDWRDERIWFAVNPGLKHGYPVLANLRNYAREAEHRPTERESFRQLHLNVWLANYNDPFIDLDVYDKGAIAAKDMPAVLERLKGKSCWIAVDMSVKNDLSAVIAAFRDDDGGYTILPFLFCPKGNLIEKQKADGVPYPAWADAGFLHPTPGPVVDYQAIVDCINDLSETYKVKEIALDQAYGREVEAALRKEGLPAFFMPLTPKIQSAGVLELERAIASGKFRHTGNPVLRWNFENVMIYTGPSGLRTMNKGKSTNRIDGAFATWMAVSRAAVPKKTSIYDDPRYAKVLAA